MFARKILGLKEAQQAVEVILEAASRQPERPVSVAVVDHQGEIVCFAKMDGATAMFNYMALKKARSSVTTGMNTRTWNQFLAKRNYTPDDFVPDATRIPGGIAIVEPDGKSAGESGPGEKVVYGGIGVSGLSGNEDEAFSIMGLEAIQKAVWG
jgi:uncharacterized protein GlcG (DUF336 family)